ncbi:hypothetical protein ACIA8K_22565 [Catenuloplanes sp. NPDC051500]|uniref:hypothetical protein n=1 Tax=Catenuloplanes sp. NPDC051500 TaxID=3363959 RepID=UPI0037A44141
MTEVSTAEPGRWRKALLAVPVAVVLIVCSWAVWYGWLGAFADEGALPPRSSAPDLPAGASVVDESVACGSGGCWRLITVAPPAGTSPVDLAAGMGLSEERCTEPTIVEPRSVCVWASPRDELLVVYSGYR